MDERKPDYARSFAAWELRLFLDTHPHDLRALRAYRMLCGCPCGAEDPDPGSADGIDGVPACEHCPDSAGGYACLPARYTSGRRFRWVDGPWPWEYALCPGKDGV